MTGITDERSFVEEARRAKLPALKALGVKPFAYRFDRTHTSAEALAGYDDSMGESGPEVSLAGRLVSHRGQGKTSFAHIEDTAGRIQLYFRQDLLGQTYDVVKLLDLGDHIGVKGVLFRTKAGEVTVRALEVTLLAKSLRPLPLGKSRSDEEGTTTYGGLHDAEVRYRQRYADLAVHPEVREVFRLRARVTSYIRRFLDSKGFLEVETPVLQPLYGGAAARPFVTHHNALDQPLYLRIADELYLKRLLVGGLERVYEIGHDFRNEGMDRTHNPEFTMLEWYQAYADYTDMMSLIEELIAGLFTECCGTTQVVRDGVTLDFTPPWPRVGFLQLVEREAGLNLRTASERELRRALAAGMPGGSGQAADEIAGYSRPKLMDELFKEFIERQLVQPTFVVDHPKALSPLAKAHRGDDRLVERFELIVQGVELANAFSELNDPDDQRARFEDQGRQRDAGDDE